MKRGILWPIVGGAALGAAVVYLTVFRFSPNLKGSDTAQNKRPAGKNKSKYDYVQSEEPS